MRVSHSDFLADLVRDCIRGLVNVDRDSVLRRLQRLDLRLEHIFSHKVTLPPADSLKDERRVSPQMHQFYTGWISNDLLPISLPQGRGK